LCASPEHVHLNACHMLEGTIHSILNSCGDHRRGRFSRERSTFEFRVSRALDTKTLQGVCDWVWATRGQLFPLVALAALLFLVAVVERVEAHWGNGL